MEKDFIDHANELAATVVNKGVSAISSLVPEPVELGDDEVVECEICSDVLPHLRAIKGFTTCVSCQQDIERRSKHYGKRYSHEWD